MNRIRRWFPGRKTGGDAQEAETVISTTDARQGGRQTMSIHVLIYSMLIILTGFMAFWLYWSVPS
jgi:hypothetical protein